MNTWVWGSVHIRAGSLKCEAIYRNYHTGASISITQGENSQDTQPKIPWNRTIKEDIVGKKRTSKGDEIAAWGWGCGTIRESIYGWVSRAWGKEAAQRSDSDLKYRKITSRSSISALGGEAHDDMVGTWTFHNPQKVLPWNPVVL